MTTKTLELFFSKLKFAGRGLFLQIRSHVGNNGIYNRTIGEERYKKQEDPEWNKV